MEFPIDKGKKLSGGGFRNELGVSAIAVNRRGIKIDTTVFPVLKRRNESGFALRGLKCCVRYSLPRSAIISQKC